MLAKIRENLLQAGILCIGLGILTGEAVSVAVGTILAARGLLQRRAVNE